MELNEKELMTLLTGLRYFLDKTYLELDTRKYYTEDFTKRVKPLVDRILKGEETFKNEDLANVYMKACEEYLKCITSFQQSEPFALIEKEIRREVKKEVGLSIAGKLIGTLADETIIQKTGITIDQLEDLKTRKETNFNE